MSGIFLVSLNAAANSNYITRLSELAHNYSVSSFRGSTLHKHECPGAWRATHLVINAVRDTEEVRKRRVK